MSPIELFWTANERTEKMTKKEKKKEEKFSPQLLLAPPRQLRQLSS